MKIDYSEKPKALSVREFRSRWKFVEKIKKKEYLESYNFFDKYPQCQTSIYNQEQNNICYAIAVGTVVSQRFCKATSTNFDLNPQPIFACNYLSNEMRSGGNEYITFRYIQYNGLPNISCYPFNLTSTCNETNCIKYYVKSRTIKVFVGEYEIQKEIKNNGPVVAAIIMTNKLAKLKNEIFEMGDENDDELDGDLHDLVIYGWGEENGIPYWLVQNSFGIQWGVNGTGKIRRGKNVCGIETYVTSAIPRSFKHDL